MKTKKCRPPFRTGKVLHRNSKLWIQHYESFKKVMWWPHAKHSLHPSSVLARDCLSTRVFCLAWLPTIKILSFYALYLFLMGMGLLSCSSRLLQQSLWLWHLVGLVIEWNFPLPKKFKNYLNTQLCAPNAPYTMKLPICVAHTLGHHLWAIGLESGVEG